MRHATVLSILLLSLGASRADAQEPEKDTSFMNGYPLRPVKISDVELKGGVLADRIDAHLNGTVPHLMERLDLHIRQFLWEADELRGKAVGPKPVPQGGGGLTLLRLVEGIGYTLMIKRDPKLEAWMDQFIDAIEVHVDKTGECWFGGALRSVPYYWATGKDKWLKLSERCAQKIVEEHFDSQGNPTKEPGIWANYEWEFCRLYQGTGNPRYLELARKFADMRGMSISQDGSAKHGHLPPMQLPIEEMKEPGGHSGCFGWFASGQTALAAMTGQEKSIAAVTRMWQNLMDTRVTIMGGVGANGGIEGFGAPYYITRGGYNETCAATGQVFYHHRLFLLTGDAKYFDSMEIVLLNAVFEGVSLDGTRFFYPNVLECNGHWGFNMQHQKGRFEWWKVVCCPGSISRTIPQIPMYMYAHAGDDLYVTLYGASKTKLPLASGTVGIDQQTEYPYDGKIALTVSPATDAQEFALRLRIPTWARERFMPSKLYQYVNTPPRWNEWELKVNGEAVKPELEKGFAVLRRSWKRGDRVELDLPMPVQITKAADRRLVAYSGRIAVTRGPLLYCAEEIDNGMRVQKLAIPELPEQDQIKISTITQGPLKGVKKISLPGTQRVDTPEPLDNREFRMYLTMPLKPYKGREKPMTVHLVPYNTWDNRGDKSMVVWIKSKAEAVPKGPLEWIPASKEEATASLPGVATTVTFKNESGRRVKVYWVSYKGERQQYGDELQPGATFKQTTYSNATWLITDENNKPLGHFISGPYDATAVIPGRE